MKATVTLARQLARAAAAAGQSIHAGPSALAGACPACCSLSRPTSSSSWASSQVHLQQLHQQQVRWASKKKHSKSQHKKASQKNAEEEEDDEVDVSDHPVPILAKGKKARAASEPTPQEVAEAFDLDKLEKEMGESVERFQREVRHVIGRVERITPALLDSVRVSEHGQRFPLQNYATVSTSGSDALIVNLFDPSYVKAVEKAIRETTDLGFNPQQADDTTLRIPVPRPDMETRKALTKKASDLAEAARVAIRAQRHQGQKDLKADQDNKVVGTGDARKDAQKLQDATKKKTDEVDAVFTRARKVLMDE